MNHYQAMTAQNIPRSKSKKDSVEIISKIENTSFEYPFAINNNPITHLNLALFKTQPCRFPHEHNKIKCPFYHNSKKDFRRNPHAYRYSSFICLDVKKGGRCPEGINCLSCHNSVELNYHPNNYKRRFCIFFPDNLHKCKFGEFCSYAHSESDILVELLHNYEFDDDFFMFHYKTSFCPINHIDHDKSLCVYAHNWQDFRRKPNKYYIQPEVCPDWNNTKIVLNYEEGCPRGFECQYCHGWKEPEYHPFAYKTKSCESSSNDCQRQDACPYYHDESENEMRIVTEEDKTFFEFVPSNRIIQGVYKVYMDQSMYGVTPLNKYNELKNDQRRIESIMLSMSSLNLHPIRGPNSMPSIDVFEKHENSSQRKNSQKNKKNHLQEDESLEDSSKRSDSIKKSTKNSRKTSNKKVPKKTKQEVTALISQANNKNMFETIGLLGMDDDDDHEDDSSESSS